MARTYSPEFKERALWMMDGHQRIEESSGWGAAAKIGEKLDVSPHTL